MIQENRLNQENNLIRDLLSVRVVKLNEIIKPGFNFGEINRSDNPKEYFAASVLNKLYSLNVSLENMLYSNDIFLAVFLYRFTYELYVKTLYVFSGSSSEEVMQRIDNFFDNKDLKTAEYLQLINDDLLPPNFKEQHQEKYKAMCKITHPNIDSMRLHLNKTSDWQFGFLIPNINLTIWHEVEIIRCFSRDKILGLDHNIDQEMLISLQN